MFIYNANLQEDSDQTCYNCNGTGHIAKYCASETMAGGDGGEGKGPRGGRGGGYNDSSCYRCGGHGHLARECPSDSRECYGCGGHGHLQKECPSKETGGDRDFDSMTCYNCGRSGENTTDWNFQLFSCNIRI